MYSDTAMASFGQQGAAFPLIANENLALPFSVLDFADFTTSSSYTSTTITYNPSNNPAVPSSSDLLQAAQDDISNQNMQSTVPIGGGG